MNSDDLPKRILYWMKVKNLDQAQIAVNAPCTPKHLSMVMNRKSKASSEMVEKIVRGIGISIREFYSVEIEEMEKWVTAKNR